ncbi:MAG: 4Fe-4S binding protein, partial [Pseudomonadota bacterium]
QKIRKAFILISFLLFPITMFYFSPAMIFKGVRLGIISGSFIIFAMLFLSGLFFGRAFCAWVCPVAGLTEVCYMVNDKKAIGGKLNWIKYSIWVPWIGTIIILSIVKGGYHSIDPFLSTKYGISLHDVAFFPFYYIVLAIIIVLSFTAGRKAFCHYVCWMAPFMIIGRKIRNIFKWPSLHLVVDGKRCTDCMKCNDNCSMSLDVQSMVYKKSMENSECILCGTCVDVCPEKAIQFKFSNNLDFHGYKLI